MRGWADGCELKGCDRNDARKYRWSSHGRHGRAAMQRKECYPRGQRSEVPQFRCCGRAGVWSEDQPHTKLFLSHHGQFILYSFSRSTCSQTIPQPLLPMSVHLQAKAIVWSTKLGTCNRSCHRLGILLVQNTSKRPCSYARHSLCGGPRSLVKATCTEKLRDRWANKCRAPDAASVRPTSSKLARPGWGGAMPRCPVHHVVTCRPLALFSQTRHHQARTQPSLWTHPTGLIHLPLRP
jgi:hypothetical protein